MVATNGRHQSSIVGRPRLSYATLLGRIHSRAIAMPNQRARLQKIEQNSEERNVYGKAQFTQNIDCDTQNIDCDRV